MECTSYSQCLYIDNLVVHRVAKSALLTVTVTVRVNRLLYKKSPLFISKVFVQLKTESFTKATRPFLRTNADGDVHVPLAVKLNARNLPVRWITAWSQLLQPSVRWVLYKSGTGKCTVVMIMVRVEIVRVGKLIVSNYVSDFFFMKYYSEKKRNMGNFLLGTVL